MTRYGLDSVRPDILRHYYETSFGDAATPAAFAGTTADEYVALARIRFPHATARRLLADSPEALGHRGQATNAPAEAEPQHSELWESVPDRFVDLADPKYLGRRIWIKRGTVSLSGAATPRSLWLSQCDATTTSVEIRRVERPLERIELSNCTSICNTLVLQAMDARAVNLQQADARVAPGLLAAMRYLEELRIVAPLIENPESLGGLVLRDVCLVRVGTPLALRQALWGSMNSLVRLMTTTVEPLRPSDLDDFSRLERLHIEANFASREEWIDWAVRHPGVACVFDTSFASMTGPSAFERYKEVYVFRHPGGRTPRYRIEHDFVDELDLDFDDNGDLEDELRARAKKAKLKLKWGSEASTLVATSTSLEEIHWVIDTCHALRRAP